MADAKSAIRYVRAHAKELGVDPKRIAAGGVAATPDSGALTGDAPFRFTARVPAEGNFRVTVTLGGATDGSATTIKAELRRLMAENIVTRAGATTPTGALTVVSPVNGFTYSLFEVMTSRALGLKPLEAAVPAA